MIKRSLVIALSMVMAVSLVACSSKEDEGKKENTTTAATENGSTTAAENESTTVAEKETVSFDICNSEYYGKVTLADYSEFVLYENEYNVSDEELNSELDALLNSYATFEDTDETKVKEESIVEINYVGYITVDGKEIAFDGGTANNQLLDIGNSNYIEGFAEGLVGAEVGKATTLNLKFPEEYTQTTSDGNGGTVTLAGQDVRFEVTVNKIQKKVVPKLTEEFVTTNLSGMFDGKTVEELKAYFINQLRIGKIVDTTALADYVEKCTVEIKKENLDKMVQKQLESINSSLEMQSMTLQDYLTEYLGGQTEEEFKESLYKDYENMYKTYGVVCAVVEDLGKVLDQARYDEIILQYAKRMGYQDAASYISYYEQNSGMNAEENLPMQLMYQEAITLIASKATVKDGEREVKDK